MARREAWLIPQKGQVLRVMGKRNRSSWGFLVRFFLLLSLAAPLCAQITTVSGTVSDTNGLAWANAQIKAQLVYTSGSPVTGQPTVTNNSSAACKQAGFGSAPCQIPFIGTVGPFLISPFGSFTVNLQDNTQVTPASTQWLFSLSITGAYPPLGTGPQFCSAQLTISGASQSISSSLNACPALGNAATLVAGVGTFDYELWVGTGVTTWSGSDIGAQLNSACSSITGGNGVIHITSGTFIYTTPFLCATVAKFLVIRGAGEGATILSYPPTTATNAVTLAGGTNNEGGIHLEDLSIVGAGSGNPTNCLQIGTSSVGLSGGSFRNLDIRGCGTGINFQTGGTVYLNNFQNVHVQGNNIGACVAGERNQFLGGLFGSNVTAPISFCAQNSDVTFHSVSIDANGGPIQLNQTGVMLDLDDDHFENPGCGTGSTPAAYYVNDTASTSMLKIYGGYMVNRCTTASGVTAQFISISGSANAGFDIRGLTVDNSAGSGATVDVSLSGNAQGVFDLNKLGPNVQTTYNTSYAGGMVRDYSHSAQSNAYINRNVVVSGNENAQEFVSDIDVICGEGIETALEYECVDKTGSFTIFRYVKGSGLLIGSGSYITSSGAGGTLTSVIGSGTSGSIGGSSLSAGACASGTVTISGAAVGASPPMTATVQEHSGTFVGGSFTVRALITASNTVTVEVCAAVAGTPTATTYDVKVIQ